MRVAAAQASSVWLDPSSTTDQVVTLMEKASRQGVTVDRGQQAAVAFTWMARSARHGGE